MTDPTLVQLALELLAAAVRSGEIVDADIRVSANSSMSYHLTSVRSALEVRYLKPATEITIDPKTCRHLTMMSGLGTLGGSSSCLFCGAVLT